MSHAASISNNERIILDTVRRNEPIQRSTIHALTSLTQPSVHRILDTLVNKQLLSIGEAKANGPGKPSPQILLNRASIYSIGVSVNTDATTICLANFACEPVHEIVLKGISQDRDAALDRIRVELDKMLKQEGITEQNVTGMCLAVPGYFTEKAYHVNTSIPLQKWSLVNLKQLLASRFDLPIWIENNATTGAIGESLIGIGQWAKTFAYLSFNYGFGGGLIIDGEPFLGTHGNAFEISGIFDDVETHKRPALKFLIDNLQANGIDVATIEELQDKFDPTWPGVEEWVEQTLPMLNRALWAISSILDPEVIVFGGQIPRALADMYLERISPRANTTHRYGVPMPVPMLKFSEASDVGAALGAALVPLKANFFI